MPLRHHHDLLVRIRLGERLGHALGDQVERIQRDRGLALPFALGVGAAAPAAPVFARRLGTKIVVPAGLILMGAGFLIASTLGSAST